MKYFTIYFILFGTWRAVYPSPLGLARFQVLRGTVAGGYHTVQLRSKVLLTGDSKASQEDNCSRAFWVTHNLGPDSPGWTRCRRRGWEWLRVSPLARLLLFPTHSPPPNYPNQEQPK